MKLSAAMFMIAACLFFVSGWISSNPIVSSLDYVTGSINILAAILVMKEI